MSRLTYPIQTSSTEEMMRHNWKVCRKMVYCLFDAGEISDGVYHQTIYSLECAARKWLETAGIASAARVT